MRQLSITAVVALLVCAGCGEDPTQLIVVVDSDLSVPDELDAVRIVVEGPTSTMDEQAALTATGPAALPVTVAVEPSGEALGPVRVRAIGLRRGVEVVARSATTTLIRGEQRVLFLPLFRGCAGQSCASGSTCVAGGCASDDVPADSLPRWDGQLPSIGDGGPPPGDDGGPRDGGLPDGGPRDAGAHDGGRDAAVAMDAGVVDAGTLDASSDAGSDDAGLDDAGLDDAGGVDGAIPTMDAGPVDAATALDAEILDGGPDAGRACLPNLRYCSGEELVVCDATGEVASRETCPLGCSTLPLPRCNDLEPTNLEPDSCTRGTATSFFGNSGGTLMVNTGPGGTTDCAEVHVQGDGTEICVIRAREIRIGGTLVVTGTRPLALVATELFRVSGTIDLAADYASAGTGARASGAGRGTAGTMSGGGAGAGHGLVGANGGAGGAGAAMGGATTGGAAIRPLHGGSTGGNGAGTGGTGGAGGGAVQLVACAVFELTGTISAGGGGGRGATSNVNGYGGGGGGSGGAILIEAPRVTVAASVVLAANGGSGGEANNIAAVGNDGRNALLTTAPAPGGAGTGAPNGGAGGAREGAAVAGQSASGRGGGGGGAVGRIRINTAAGHAPTFDASSTVSPAASTGAVGTR